MGVLTLLTGKPFIAELKHGKAYHRFLLPSFLSLTFNDADPLEKFSRYLASFLSIHSIMTAYRELRQAVFLYDLNQRETLCPKNKNKQTLS